MNDQFSLLKRTILNLGSIYVVFFLLRVLFYFINEPLLEVNSIFEFIRLSFWGLRFDTSTIFYCNSLYILLMTLPFDFRLNSIYQKITTRLFFMVNLIVIFIELIDVFYFKYNMRRIIASDFILFKNAFSHSQSLLGEYLIYIICLMLFIGLSWFILKKFNHELKNIDLKLKYQLPLFIITMIFFVIGSRGGLQLRPLSPIIANQYTTSINTALVSNAMQNLFLVAQQRTLKPKTYFSEEKLVTVYDKRINGSNNNFKPYNVVLIALEGIGQEYIGYYNDESNYTPFLDSILRNNANSIPLSFANGTRSTHGITSITTGLPNLMNDPFMFSAYQNNELIGLPGYLKKMGYHTSFYHGAYEGSMNFDQFTKSIGFDEYIDMTKYPNEGDYDGSWGIWDDKFFQYFADELGREKEPFMSMIFTLTSHHPYNVENWFKDKYPDMNKTKRAALYLDYSLNHFFEKVKKEPWYDNTLFVICADHIGLTFSKKYRTKVTKYGIPILYKGTMFHDSMQKSSITSQIDILPTVLDVLDYPNSISTYGESIFNVKDSIHYTYMLDRNIYQILDEKYILTFNKVEETKLYNYIVDPNLKNNIYTKQRNVAKRMETRLKAVLQKYTDDMLYNKLSK